MNFYDIPEDARLTTEQLQQYEVRCGGKLIPLALCEEESALVHMEKKFPREDYWIYLPGTQGADIRSLTLGGHQLQRSIEEPHWHVGKNLLHIDFTQPGQWVETLSIREHNPNTAEPGLHFIYRRYMATDEPDAEKTGESEMITNRLTQDGEVVGVRGYREKLYIPRIVDGKTVTRVALPGWSRSKYLRELVIEEDIELVDFDFHCETLEEIRIPESVQLAGPPVGILDTAWYRGQDEGDVYFCGYYCGTKGPTTRSVLRIREGTIGILDDAYGGDYLRQVILPESVAYIGKNAFAENKELMRILLPESAKDLSPALGIDGCRVPVFPGASSVVHPARKDFNGLTGWDLYALGRTGEAAKAVIPACYEPLAPKLTYDDGWIAHYYYSMEGQHQADCLLSLRIPTGAVVHNARFAPLTDRTSPLWSKNRRPAHYHWAADYLAHCAELISKGEPTVEQLRRLEEKWIRTHPDRLRNSLYYLEKEQKGITGIPPRVPSPEVFRLQAHIRKNGRKFNLERSVSALTGEELYRLGSESKEALFLIHHELGHTMPRLGWVQGRLAAEFWYFSIGGNEKRPAEYVKKYAAIDPYTQEIICIRSYTAQEEFPASYETCYLAWQLSHGIRYLNRCVRVLNKDRITDGELRRLRRRWMDLQPDWIRRYAAAPQYGKNPENRNYI